MPEQKAPTSLELAEERTDLAVKRTLLALERTLNAWVRTATSLISFGFTIYKFADWLNETRKTAPPAVLNSRHFAMAMILVGLTGLILAIGEHARTRATLRAEGHSVPRSIAQLTAILVAGLGVLGFYLAMFRL